MIRRFMRWLFAPPEQSAPPPVESSPSTHRREVIEATPDISREMVRRLGNYLRAAFEATQRVKAGDYTGDSSGSDNPLNIKGVYNFAQPNIPDSLLMWYGAQTFIGHQTCALIAQHWLVDKICTIPAEDAIRQGYDVVSAPGAEPLSEQIIAAYANLDKRFRVIETLTEYARFGRIFGIRIAIPIIEGATAEYYEQPFNADGVLQNTFKGWTMVDPYWTSPILDGPSAAKPDSQHFYEPTWWLINGIKYHRTHLCIFRTEQPADILKPAYLYSGVPIPQKIMERVYSAERTANEAPMLALTKRMYVQKVQDIAAIIAKKAQFDQLMQFQRATQDNYATKIIGANDEFSQQDTSLAELSDVIDTMYAVACAAGNVPVNKAMGTAAGGLSNEGAYDEANYHEFLESLQTHRLTPFLERHHLLCRKSYIEPQFGDAGKTATAIFWAPLDSPTAKELSDTNKTKADTDQIYFDLGVLDSASIAQRLNSDRDSGYSNLPVVTDNGSGEEI